MTHDPESYEPKPIDTSCVNLSPDITELVERLAEHNHDVWARGRIADGWRFGPERSDVRRENPCIVSYDDLPETEKEYDRNAAIGTLKAIVALGYRITKTGSH